MPATPELLKAIAVTAKVMGNELDEASARMFADDLSAYPQSAVIDSLGRCRREVRGRLTIADVVQRLDDGRPGVEEAWAMLPKSEDQSVVWCDEMAKAFGVAVPLMDAGDMVGARMAFKEAYTAQLQRARTDGVPVKWRTSYGFDKAGRVKAVREAADRKRLTQTEAATMIQHIGPIGDAFRIGGNHTAADAIEHMLLSNDSPGYREAGKTMLAELKKMLKS